MELVNGRQVFCNDETVKAPSKNCDKLFAHTRLLCFGIYFSSWCSCLDVSEVVQIGRNLNLVC
jgi:hypothetical protein